MSARSLPGSLADAVPRPDVDADRAVLAVVAVAGLALLARLVFLGSRIAHFDEARVGYWSLYYLRTGAFHYRFIIHGPFVQHVDRLVFALVGANDFTLRLVVAVIGGLLPLAALLFRGRLRDDETVAFAAFLAFDPVILYYSRFLRSTLLVAGFMLVALGFGLRAYDRGRPRDLYLAAVFAALGFASKENALVYVVAWLGAGVLLLDARLMAPREHENGFAVLQARGARARATLSDPDGRARVGTWLAHVALAAGLFLLVGLFFYAPRAPNSAAVGLWEAVARPARFGALLDATWADVERGLNYWIGGSAEPGCHKETLMAGYRCYLGRFLGVMGEYALPLSLFAVLGTFAERYGTGRARPLVMFTAYWGFVSVLGYPLGTDIFGAWIVVNALVPLAIPAAVGVGIVWRSGRDALADGDRVGAALAALVLLVAVVATGSAAVSGVYLHPTADSNDLVQYAQPADDFRPVVRDLNRAAAAHGGLDVLFYGERVSVPAGTGGGPDPDCSRMVTTLPLQWYVATADATADCAYNETALEAELAAHDPPVVVAHVNEREALDPRLEGYTARVYRLRTSGRRIVFYVKDRYVANTTG